jgi:hypothetical protein
MIASDWQERILRTISDLHNLAIDVVGNFQNLRSRHEGLIT